MDGNRKTKILPLLRDAMVLIISIVYCTCESVLRRFVTFRKKSLVGEVALITGAGHGLGREFALQLSQLGVKVICWDINTKTCHETAKQVRDMGGDAESFQCDVSSREQVADTARLIREKSGRRVTLLFNNAGILNACKPFTEITDGEVEQIFRVNVFSQFWMLSEFLPDLMSAKNGGHIVCISSSAGLTGTPNMTSYCSTKYATNGLMEALRCEYTQLYPKGKLLMTTVYPFTINTGLAKKSYTRFPWLLPTTTEADVAVKEIIAGVRRNKRKIYIPAQIEPMFCLNHILPNKVGDTLREFLGVGVDPHYD